MITAITSPDILSPRNTPRLPRSAPTYNELITLNYTGEQLKAALPPSPESASGDEIEIIANQFEQLVNPDEESSEGKVFVRIELLAKLKELADKGQKSTQLQKIPADTLRRILNVIAPLIQEKQRLIVSIDMDCYREIKSLLNQAIENSKPIETRTIKSEWMKIAIAANAVMIAFLFIFSCFYCSGTFTFDVFSGSVGVAVTICGTLLLTLIAGSLFCLGFRHVERIK